MGYKRNALLFDRLFVKKVLESYTHTYRLRVQEFLFTYIWIYLNLTHLYRLMSSHFMLIPSKVWMGSRSRDTRRLYRLFSSCEAWSRFCRPGHDRSRDTVRTCVCFLRRLPPARWRSCGIHRNTSNLAHHWRLRRSKLNHIHAYGVFRHRMWALHLGCRSCSLADWRWWEYFAGSVWGSPML